MFSSGFLLYRWPDCLPNDRCERHPPRSPVRSRGVATAPSYDFRSGRGPSESASARGGNEGDHCTHASQRGLSQTVTRMGISRAPERRRQSTATTCAGHQTEHCRPRPRRHRRHGCCRLPWLELRHRVATARELLPSTPEAGFAAIIERVQWHCAPHDDYSRVEPGSPHLAARPFSYGASPCLPPSTGRTGWN